MLKLKVYLLKITHRIKEVSFKKHIYKGAKYLKNYKNSLIDNKLDFIEVIPWINKIYIILEQYFC